MQVGPDQVNGRRPLGAVVSSALEGVRRLVRKEIELASLEIKKAASERAVGLALFAGAAVLGFVAFLFLSWAIAAALSLVMPAWLAFLVVAVVYAAIAAGLALAGRRALSQAPGLPRTQESLKEDAGWVKQQIAR